MMTTMMIMMMMMNMTRKEPYLIDAGELESVEKGHEDVRHDRHRHGERQAEHDEGDAVEVDLQRSPQHRHCRHQRHPDADSHWEEMEPAT